MSASSKKKSPLKSPPLRQAGESVTNRLIEAAFDQGAIWICVGSIGLLLTFFAISMFFGDPVVVQRSMFMGGIGAVVISFWKLRHFPATARGLRLGVEGERAVADLLNDLAASGYRVIHDLQFDGFNVDHVLVGPSGIYAIETKTRSKIDAIRNIIRFDGARVQINDGPWTDDDVQQTGRQARAVEDLLRRHMAKSFKVRPVLLYPGWWVKGPDHRSAIWVTNQNRFAGFVRKERDRLSKLEVQQVFESLASSQRIHDSGKQA